jgi:hypothetical protein
MSSRSRLCGRGGRVGGPQKCEDDAGEASLERSQRFHGGVSLLAAALVVGLAQAVQADLGDRDAVARR